MGSDYDSDGNLKPSELERLRLGKEKVRLPKKGESNTTNRDIVRVLERIESLLEKLIKFEEKKETY